MRVIITSFIFILLCGAVSADGLMPFKSDGCSAFPDGTFADRNLWLNCCIEHDKAYWAGGTKEQKEASDEKLKQCVAEIGQPQIADIMLKGVQVGGTPYLPTTFRWGYGWPYPRGFKPLTEQELLEVEHEMEKYLQRNRPNGELVPNK